MSRRFESGELPYDTRSVQTEHTTVSGEHIPLFEVSRSRQQSKGKRKFVIRCGLLVIGLLVLVLSMGIGSTLYYASSMRFTSEEIQVVQGDYVLAPLHYSFSDLMYYKLDFSLAQQSLNVSVPINIYRILCDQLPIVEEKFEFIEFTLNFSNCSNQICLFDKFVYEAASNVSELFYEIEVEDFDAGVTSIQVLAFYSSNPLYDEMKVLKKVEMKTREFNFSMNSTEIMESSYYSFGVMFNHSEPSRTFLFNRSGVHVYYNASKIRSWCILNASNSTGASSSCSTHLMGNSRFCYIIHATVEEKQSEDKIIAIEATISASPFSRGYLIIASVVVGLVIIIVCITLFVWWQKQKKKKGSRNQLSTTFSANESVPEDTQQCANYTLSDDDIESDSSSLSSSTIEPDQSMTTESEDDTTHETQSANSTIEISSSESGCCELKKPDSCVASQTSADLDTDRSSEYSDDLACSSSVIKSKNTVKCSSHCSLKCGNDTTDEELSYEKIQFNEKGLVYHSCNYGASIVVPEGAVNRSTTLRLGASVLLPDFEYECSFEPILISPFIWVHTDTPLSKPAKLYIPHHIDTNYNEKSTNVYLLAKGHENNAVFKVMEGAFIQVFETVACVMLEHFCTVCLVAAREGTPPKRRYHAVSAEKNIDQNTKEVHLCVLYTLDCLQNLRSYYEDRGFTITIVEYLKGELCDEGLTLSVDLPITSIWKFTNIGKNQKAIKTEDIDMYKALDCCAETVTKRHIEYLETYQTQGTYPPPFRLQFYVNGHCDNIRIPVPIAMKGLSSGEFLFTTMLGENFATEPTASLSSSLLSSSQSPYTSSQSSRERTEKGRNKTLEEPQETRNNGQAGKTEKNYRQPYCGFQRGRI